MGWDGKGWDGMERDGMGWDEMGWNGMGEQGRAGQGKDKRSEHDRKSKHKAGAQDRKIVGTEHWKRARDQGKKNDRSSG